MLSESLEERRADVAFSPFRVNAAMEIFHVAAAYTTPPACSSRTDTCEAMSSLAVVVGAGPGLGAALARTFAAHHSAVAVLGRTLKTVEGVADDVRKSGGDVSVLSLDQSVKVPRTTHDRLLHRPAPRSAPPHLESNPTVNDRHVSRCRCRPTRSHAMSPTPSLSKTPSPPSSKSGHLTNFAPPFLMPTLRSS